MDQLLGYPTPASLLWAALALLAAGGVFWLARRQGPVLAPAWMAIALLVAAAMLPAVGFLRSYAPYYVQVSVLAAPGAALDRFKIWSSAEGRTKRNGDGWEIEIPSAVVPDDRTVMVWATLDPKDLTHSHAVILKNDHHPKVTIRMTGDRSAKIAGMVRDQDGKPVDGALISLADRPQGSVLTQLNGSFVLPVDAEQGDQVRIQVATPKRLLVQWVTAGDRSLVVTVDRSEKN